MRHAILGGVGLGVDLEHRLFRCKIGNALLDTLLNRMTGEVSYGRIPSGSVVVSGSLPAADGSHSLYCAVIVKRVTAETRAKTSINELLRA